MLEYLNRKINEVTLTIYDERSLAWKLINFSNKASRFYDEQRNFMLFMLGIALIKFFIININYVPTGSMNPSIVEGDIVLVNKIASHFREPSYGDIISFQKDNYYVKRVVGLPGDRVQLIKGSLYLNGKKTGLTVHTPAVPSKEFPSAEKYSYIEYKEKINDSKPYSIVQLPMKNALATIEVRQKYYDAGVYAFDSPEYTVPTGKLFVLGDNRPLSKDSRYNTMGFVEISEIKGYPIRVLFNLKHLFTNGLDFVLGKEPEYKNRLFISLN